MKASQNLTRDVVTGLFFSAGMLSFMSGEFVLSTLFFGSASLSSNLQFAKPARA